MLAHTFSALHKTTILLEIALDSWIFFIYLSKQQISVDKSLCVDLYIIVNSLELQYACSFTWITRRYNLAGPGTRVDSSLTDAVHRLMEDFLHSFEFPPT